MDAIPQLALKSLPDGILMDSQRERSDGYDSILFPHPGDQTPTPPWCKIQVARMKATSMITVGHITAHRNGTPCGGSGLSWDYLGLSPVSLLASNCNMFKGRNASIQREDKVWEATKTWRCPTNHLLDLFAWFALNICSLSMKNPGGPWQPRCQLWRGSSESKESRASWED